MAKRKRETKCWMVVESGHAMLFTAAGLRGTAIYRLERQTERRWPELREAGYRVVKATLTWEEES